MPSKKSIVPSKPTFLWKSAQNCSERELSDIARALAATVVTGDLLLLEGPMGVGKSTFARAFLSYFGIEQGGAGSPTFAIAHEYLTSEGQPLLHADLYRLRSEDELEDTGINAAIWERELICLVEWSSLFPGWVASVEKNPSRRLFKIDLAFSSNAEFRSVQITQSRG